MKDLLRKDKLLIIAFGFSCLMMYISSPNVPQLKELVWDFSFVVAAFAAAGWAVIEALDFLGSVVLGVSPVHRNVQGVSRVGLIAMAEKGGLAPKKALEAMSDEDLIALVANMNGAEVKGSYGKNLILATSRFWMDMLKKFFGWTKRVYYNIKAKIWKGKEKNPK